VESLKVAADGVAPVLPFVPANPNDNFGIPLLAGVNLQ
jgi:hypothetical protein